MNCVALPPACTTTMSKVASTNVDPSMFNIIAQFPYQRAVVTIFNFSNRRIRPLTHVN